MTDDKTTLQTFKDDHELYFDFLEFWFNFKPHKYQRKFLIDCLMKNRVAGVWCRQSGKSTCVAIYLLFRVLVEPTGVMITAPGQSQAAELYLKVKILIENNPLINAQVDRLTQTEFTIKNNSRVKALPTGPEGKSSRGFTADVIVQEEAGLTSDEITNTAITPIIASKKKKGQIIKIGTPLTKNHFYHSLYDQDTKYEVTKITYKDCLAEGQYDQDFIDEQKRNLTSVQFRTEYEAEFIDEQASFFPTTLIQNSMEDYKLIAIY